MPLAFIYFSLSSRPFSFHSRKDPITFLLQKDGERKCLPDGLHCHSKTIPEFLIKKSALRRLTRHGAKKDPGTNNVFGSSLLRSSIPSAEIKRMKKDRVFFLPNHEPESSDFPPLEGLDITKTEKGEPFTGNYDQSRLWKQF